MYLTISRKINNLDNYILFAIRKYLKNKYLDILMPIFTMLGNLGCVWIIIAIILSLDNPFSHIGSIVLFTLIISTVIGEGIIKHVVRRIRPCNQQSDNSTLIIKPMSYSFPSGHTLSSFAVAKVLSMYCVEYKLVFFAIALLIALSRLYLYVHYPTDVISGIVIGMFCSKIVLVVIEEGYLQRFTLLCKNIL